ncbi:hypothetical protein A3752_19315 [Oleiphilus sp. HI0081]|nr:hypothetical protein A3752_19315 [Oleiphilus sp. HI0081]
MLQTRGYQGVNSESFDSVQNVNLYLHPEALVAQEKQDDRLAFPAIRYDSSVNATDRSAK